MDLYEITIDSPLGPKAGTLTVEYTENQVSGVLSALGHDNPFSGERTGETSIRIRGELCTAFNTLPCEAVLDFGREQVAGTARAGGVTLPIHGVKRPAGGGGD